MEILGVYMTLEHELKVSYRVDSTELEEGAKETNRQNLEKRNLEKLFFHWQNNNFWLAKAWQLISYKEKTEELFSFYLDTETKSLAKEKIALRLRSERNERVCLTLKGAKKEDKLEGLTVRPELNLCINLNDLKKENPLFSLCKQLNLLPKQNKLSYEGMSLSRWKHFFEPATVSSMEVLHFLDLYWQGNTEDTKESDENDILAYATEAQLARNSILRKTALTFFSRRTVLLILKKLVTPASKTKKNPDQEEAAIELELCFDEGYLGNDKAYVPFAEVEVEAKSGEETLLKESFSYLLEDVKKEKNFIISPQSKLKRALEAKE